MIIYFAGMQPYPYFTPIARNVLSSYILPSKRILERKANGDIDKLMIDSGAFTFFAEAGFTTKRLKTSKTPNIDDYIHEYCRYLVTHRKLIDYYIELDIDKVVGWDKVLELRHVFDTYNLAPIYVWHPTLPIPFEDFCKKYDYFGVGTSTKSAEILTRMLETAQKHKSKIHIFGFTRANDLLKMAKYKSLESVDSTSWCGSKYGRLFGGIHNMTKSWQGAYSKDLNHRKINKLNIIKWKQFEMRLNSIQQGS